MTNPNVPSLALPVTGQPISQSYLKAQMYDPLNFLLNKPVCTMNLGGTDGSQTSNNAYQTVAFTTAASDNWGGYKSNLNGYQVPCAGTYLCSYAITFAASATGVRAAYLQQNSGNVTDTNIWGIPPNANFMSIEMPPVAVACAAGDLITVTAYQNTGGNFGIKAQGTFLTVEFAHF